MASASTKRVAIITGAAQGIGRSIALRLGRDGLDLGLFDLPECKDLLEELAAGIRAEHGTRIVTVYGDVSVDEDVKRLVDTTTQELGDLYAVRSLDLLTSEGSYNVVADDCECRNCERRVFT